MKLFQGDNYIDQIFYGESVFGPLHDPMFIPKSDPKPDQLAQWRRIATEIAKARLPLHVHANLTNTIDAFLDQIEQIHKEYPIKNLRWTLAHVNQLNASHLERMKKLGHVRGRASLGRHQRRHQPGRCSATPPYDMAQLSTIQNSGIMWGFGSDGSRANQIQPFTTLWWAVTGKMVGGTRALRESQTDLPRGRADRAHAQERVLPVPGGQPRLDSARQAGRPRRAGSRLPDGSGRSDQGHQVGDDDGRRARRLRCQRGAGRSRGVRADEIGDHEHDEEDECDPDRRWLRCSRRVRRSSPRRPWPRRRQRCAKVTVSGEAAKRIMTKTQINATRRARSSTRASSSARRATRRIRCSCWRPNGDTIAAQVMDGQLPIAVETAQLKAKTASVRALVVQRRRAAIRHDRRAADSAGPREVAGPCVLLRRRRSPDRRRGPADRGDRRRRRNAGRAVRVHRAHEGARPPAAAHARRAARRRRAAARRGRNRTTRFERFKGFKRSKRSEGPRGPTGSTVRDARGLLELWTPRTLRTLNL